jgi:actin-like ATPase involved in cell morphogenesis
MADGLGLSVGATRLTAVVVGRTALSRSPVLTKYPHRPAEVGVPSENPNLTERGLILTDFVDRVGDPVGIVAADGTSHRGADVLADALRALLATVTGGGAPEGRVAITHPAHWSPTAVEALRDALNGDFGGAEPTLVSDAPAALAALQDDPGLPTRGVVALCDFGGTGTSVTLVDVGNGYSPLAPTVRHPDLSGAAIDQALLTHVINDLSAAGAVDLTGTSAIGSLTRLRGQCRAAKERLSATTVTSLVAELPGHTSDVRLTRAELDDVVRRPLDEFLAAVDDAIERAGVRPADLAAIATAGGGARIPIITATLSERFRVPVITTPQPELTAAIGGGLTAERGGIDDAMTAMAPPVAAAALGGGLAAGAASDDMAESSTFRALAWSDAEDIPDVTAGESYDYDSPAAAAPAGATTARPQLAFGDHEPEPAEPPPWYRRPPVLAGLGAAVVVALVASAILYALRGDSDPAPASPSVTATTPAPAPPPAPPPTEAPPPETPAPAETVFETAPPPAAPETQAPPPPPPSSQAPPPPPTTTAPPPPPTTTAPPPTTTQPPLIPTLPYTTIPGLPFVPAPPPTGGG